MTIAYLALKVKVQHVWAWQRSNVFGLTLIEDSFSSLHGNSESDAGSGQR